MIATFVLRDSATMLRRQLLHLKRYPLLTITVIGQPILFLLLFVYVFGGTMGAGLPGSEGGAGSRTDYLVYITPGILIMTVASVAVGSAISVAIDMTGGIIGRFRTMDISRVAVLTGHVLGALLRTLLALLVVIAFAFLLGYRSHAGLLDWSQAFGLLMLLALALTWLAVGLGLAADGIETASNTPMFLIILPLVSSAYVPTDAMPAGLRQFAEYQPFTPITDTIRALATGAGPGADLWVAVAWCVLIGLAGYRWSRRLFLRMPAK
ncbi:MAG TPA: ABC transporter permease [Actinomycetes bacterium]|nr:ABC transporter permease [Actinomycetes bacterium]